MKLRDLLEETFDISDITKKILNFLLKDIKENGYGDDIELDKYFKSFIKKINPKFKKQILMSYDVVIKNAKWPTGGEVKEYPSEILVSFLIPENISKEKLYSLIYHEFIHVLDFIRIGKKIENLPKKYSKTTGGYMRASHEFNALIHEMKLYISRRKEEYNKIINKKEFFKFLNKEEKFDKFLTDFSKLAKENEVWFKKLLKRLARENLLPKNLR